MHGNCRHDNCFHFARKWKWMTFWKPLGHRKNFSKEYNQSEKCDLNIKKRKKNTKKKEFINLPLRHSVKNLPKNKQSL